MLQVPELSLKLFTHGTDSDRVKFSHELYEGLKEYGFIILKDHPIEVSLLHEAYRLTAELFTYPLETKTRWISPAGGGQRGYTPFGKEHAKNNHVPDLKEFWHVGRTVPVDHALKGFFPDNIWPEELPAFAPVMQKMFSRLDDTGRIMLQALTLPLEVQRHFFDEMTMWGSSVLRLLHYPPIPADADPRSIRAAAHEDINLITLLVSASSSGLELLTRDGQWLSIDTSPENIIVDSGDMLARITNDVLPATTHRVVNPQGPNRSRYSMPFFMHPNPDAWLGCIPSCEGTGAKYAPILANDFLKERLREIGLVPTTS